MKLAWALLVAPLLLGCAFAAPTPRFVQTELHATVAGRCTAIHAAGIGPDTTHVMLEGTDLTVTSTGYFDKFEQSRLFNLEVEGCTITKHHFVEVDGARPHGLTKAAVAGHRHALRVDYAPRVVVPPLRLLASYWSK